MRKRLISENKHLLHIIEYKLYTMYYGLYTKQDYYNLDLLIKLLTVALLILLVFLILGDCREILCPAPVVVYSDCNVSVDCCCPTATPSETPSATDAATRTATFSSTNTVVPTRRSSRTPTQTPKVSHAPTATPTAVSTAIECYQWLCHKPGTAAEQDYCCDSQECVDAHLGHGDYLGKCK